jgi:S1-C subfamily serine protease
MRGVQGSALCIHPEGIFLTNEHVIRDEGEINLILNPGSNKARVLPVKVPRVDRDLDLALLRVEKGADFPVLPLATETNLIETDVITAFGFPASKVARFLACPEILFDIPTLELSTIHQAGS